MHPNLLFALFALAVLALTVAAVHSQGTASAAAATTAAAVFAASLSATASVPAQTFPTAATATGLADASTPAATSGLEPLSRGNKLDDSAGSSKWRRVHGHLDNGLYYGLGLLTLYLRATGYYDDWDEDNEDVAQVEGVGGWQGGWEVDDEQGLNDDEPEAEAGGEDLEAVNNGEEVDWVLYATCALSLASLASQMLSPPDLPAVGWSRTLKMASYFLTGMIANGGHVFFPGWLWHCLRWVQEIDQACGLFGALRMVEGRPGLFDVLLPSVYLYRAVGFDVCYPIIWYSLGRREMLWVLRERGLL